MTQIDSTFPARPNGVTLSNVVVEGGALDEPHLTNYPGAEDEVGSTEMQSPYTMAVSRFELSYTARDCGFGIGLLIGTYDNDLNITVEQVSINDK